MKFRRQPGWSQQVKYHPWLLCCLTVFRNPESGPCVVGSLTGAVASQSVTEARDGELRTVGNRPSSAMAKARLTVTLTSGTETKVGHSDPVVSAWKGHRSTDKRYSRDNRLIAPKRPQRRRCLAPRCRLISSWGWSRSQGYGCSPFKEVRELGSERRETVRSLSAVGVGVLRGSVLSTRGPGWTHPWCTCCRASGIAG